MITARVFECLGSTTKEELVKYVTEKCEKNETYLNTMSEDIFSLHKDCGMTLDEASSIYTSILKIYNILARYKFDILNLEESDA